MRSVRRPTALLAVVAALVLTAGQPVALAEGRSVLAGTAVEPVPCPMDVPDPTRVECGLFSVPQSRARPDGPRAELLVTVLHSAVPRPTAVPVLVTAGGPGSSSAGLAGLVHSVYAEERDVVVLEQRGTRYSRPSLDCPELSEAFIAGLTTPDPPADEVPAQVAAARACADRLRAEGVDPADFTTAENAADVAELRVALGHPEWDLWGMSYSTRLVLTVLRDHPEGVRSVVLDSVQPTDVPEYDGLVAGLQSAWGRLVEDCAAQPRCAAAWPDLETALARAAARLDADPLEVTAVHPDTGEPVDLQLTGDDLVTAVLNALYDPQAIRYVPLLVDRFGAGDAAAARPVADAAVAELTGTSLGLYYSMQCAEMAPLTTPAAAEEDAGALTGRAATRFVWLGADLEICPAWDVPVRPEAAALVDSDVPVLVLAGRYDPITPPAYGQDLAARLPGATFVEVPGQGHAPSLEGDCAPSIVVGFLDDPQGPVDTGCLAELGPADVVLPAEVHLSGGPYRLASDGATPGAVGLCVALLGLLTAAGGLVAGLLRGRRHPGRRRAPAQLALAAVLLDLGAVTGLALLVRDTLAVDELMLGFGLPAVGRWLLVAPPVALLVAGGGLALAVAAGRRGRAATDAPATDAPVVAAPVVVGGPAVVVAAVAVTVLAGSLAALDLLP